MQPTPFTFGQFVPLQTVNTNDFIDVTSLAESVGFHFPTVVMSQHAWFSVIDVPDSVVNLDKDALTRGVLRLARRAARQSPMSYCVAFTVCQPPTQRRCYVHHPVTLVAKIEQCAQHKPVLIIALEEEESELV